MLASCLVYSSTPKKEATYSSETPVGFQRNTCRYISGDKYLHSHLWENRKSYGDHVCFLSVITPKLLNGYC
jgi:hypothetical protein